MLKRKNIDLNSFQCILEGQKSKSFELKHNEKRLMGRSKYTKIKDIRLSKDQLELTADFYKKIVLIKQLGPNDSRVNGKTIGIGLEITAKDGDTIDLLFDQFSYKILFLDLTKPLVEVRNTSGKNLGDFPPPKKIPKMFLPNGHSSAADFRKEPSSSIASGDNWENIKGNELLIYSSDARVRTPSTNIAAFDMDGTIITTKSGRVFPRDDSDWRFLSNLVVTKLNTFLADNSNFKVVIFTNQAGLGKHANQIPSFKKKIETIAKAMGIPIILFMATGKSEFRKPMIESWNVFVQKYNGGVEPDRSTSFYCGDAAGRKKDHSIGDRLFALNLQLPFKTPEEFFQGQKAQGYTQPVFNPSQLVENTVLSNNHIDFPHPQEMIVFVGYPGSGKSSFVKAVLVPRGYLHVNRDTMKSMPKCLSAAGKSLAEGKSVVIDNTNGTKKAREDFMKVAKKHNSIVRCFKIMVDFTQAQHNNKFRQLAFHQDSVPAVAFNTYRSQFQEPKLDEGFVEIVPVHFVPSFENEEHKKLYSMFLLENY